MREAVEHTNAEIVIFVDGDGTYSVANIGDMVEPLLDDTADMTRWVKNCRKKRERLY